MRLAQAGTRLIGRTREIDDVIDLVHQQRLVTLTGAGGAGKTRLADGVLDELEPEFSGGAFVIPLAELTDASLVGSLVAADLGVRLPGTGFAPRQLTDRIGDDVVLLLLDNCEHLLDAVAELVATLLDACPALTVLATSRIPLGLGREHVYDLAPLGLPEPSHTPEQIAEVESVQLFVERAQSAHVGFKLTGTNAATVAGIVTALDGLPLAIELAGARVREIAPELLLSRLGDHLTVLDSGYRDQPERHRSLSANLAWSYQLCSPEEQSMWSRLAVFAGGFDLDAAEAVAPGDGITLHDVLPLVSALVTQSVLAPDHTTPGRYRMLEPVRQFGLRQLSADQASVWKDRHLAWVADLAADLIRGVPGPDQLRRLGRMRADSANLRAALEHAVTQRRHVAVAFALCRDLEPYWLCEGLMTEARHWVDQALATSGTESGDNHVEAASMVAWFGAAQLDPVYAHTAIAQVTQIADDASPVARAHYDTAVAAIAFYDQDYAVAVRHGELAMTALALAGRRVSYEYVQAISWRALGLISLGRVEEARALIDEAIATSDRFEGELYWRTSFYWMLGVVLIGAGDLDTALAHEREALRCSWALRMDVIMAITIEALAVVNAAQGRNDAAAFLFGGATRELIRVQITHLFTDLRQATTAAVEQAIGSTAYRQAFDAGTDASLSSLVDFALTGQDPRTAENPFAPLTRREAEIAGLVAQGLGNRAIAERLVLSERTVQGHIQNTLYKLHATSRAAIATWYVRRTPADQPPHGEGRSG